MDYNYQYFSGANVTILIDEKELIECAGISFSIQNSQQPLYGYGSSRFDVMLPGREIVQGNFVINFTKPNYLSNLIGNNTEQTSLNSNLFDIKVSFGDKEETRILKSCCLISMGQTIQISEQVILEEYGFIARSIKNMN